MIHDIPEAIRLNLIQTLTETTGKTLKLLNFSFFGGGCVNHGGKLETSEGGYFLKWNDLKKFPNMFKAETKGLQLLSTTDTLRIPKVVSAGETNEHQFLLLEYFASAKPSDSYSINLGEKLASLHRFTANNFGLDHSNFIGSLPQYNGFKPDWIDFFIHERLEIQLTIAEEDGLVDPQLRNQFLNLYKRLPIFSLRRILL
ncbi:MAG TPA: fructosamine kinase family protein [Ohtaekwangia sp.]|nr:fructosamine kinase family protein [Ohtaekwangia sp.]